MSPPDITFEPRLFKKAEYTKSEFEQNLRTERAEQYWKDLMCISTMRQEFIGTSADTLKAPGS